MGNKMRGLGHAVRDYQLAQASAAQSGGTGAGSPMVGRVVGPPLTIESPVSEYQRKFDHRYAKHVREMLHALTANLAKAKGMAPRKAFRDSVDGLTGRFGFGEYDTLYLLTVAWMVGLRFSSREEACAGLKAFLDLVGSDAITKEVRYARVWRLWDRFCSLFGRHMRCSGRGSVVPLDQALLALDVWLCTDVRAAPCLALDAVRASRGRGIADEQLVAFARAHGATRLGDFARLCDDGLVTSDNAWELLTRPELVRALSHAQLDWLLREWSRVAGTELLAFARERRGELRAKRGTPLSVGTADKAVRPDTVADAFDLVFRNATPEESASNGRQVVWMMHGDDCPRDRLRAGRYVPSNDDLLGPELPRELVSGMEARTRLGGGDLEARTERVRALFGEDVPGDQTLFALDLLCLWGDSADPSLCVRAAAAARRARVPDSLAFDLLVRFGYEHAEEAVALIERGLLGLKECQRLLKNPVLIVERRGRMRDLLERYRDAGSPADLYAFAHGRSAARDVHGRKPERTMPAARIILRETTAQGDPARYLAAIEAAETRRQEAVVATEPEPVSTTHSEPVADTPAPAEPVPAETREATPVRAGSPNEGPLLRTMREIGDDIAVEGVARAWEDLVSLFPRDRRDEIVNAVEPILARMIRAESRVQPKKTVPRERCYNNVVRGTFLDNGRDIDDMALSTLLSFEKIGLTFATHQEFRAFYLGISERVGHTVGHRMFGDEQLATMDLLCEHLRVHLPHLSTADRTTVVGSMDTLLLGIDLFAEGGGNVPLCKSFRLTANLRRRQIGRDESFWLYRMFTAERADDLVALLENRRVPTRNIERLFQRPETVAGHAYEELVTLLAA